MSHSAVISFIARALLAAALLALCSCSPNKNNAATRRYQEFITRYNIHYNGDTHMQETLQSMESAYEDDFSRRLLMHPAQARGQEGMPQPNGNFDRSIEKAQKAIQLRSIKKKPKRRPGRSSNPEYKLWLKREEYNPFLHNSWMMLADGQYYNGDFLGAASTYFYISKHFWWLPKTVTEAKLMQALSYITLGWQFEAEMIITRIKENELSTKHLRGLYNFVQADFHLHADDYEAALPYLQQAARDASGAQKTRLNFLLGQVLARLGRNDDAYAAFARAASSSSTTYRTKFNARIKQSEVFTGDNIEPEVRALRRMTRYDRNSEYLDQIYYAIGNLYLSRGDTTNAIANYVTANEKSTRSGVDKAINQETLGRLYFEQGRYDLAQPSYSEAVPLLPAGYPDLERIRRRSDVLNELAVYSGNVTLQDSLLRLAAMPESERMAVIERIIEELKETERRQAEDAEREEFLANQAAQGNQLQDNTTQSFVINSDNSWYFYNTATRNAGRTEFQRRWGSRKLEDNWRRRNKATFSVDDFNDTGEESDDTGEETENTGDETGSEGTDPTADAMAERASDPHFPEYYLAQIPLTEADKTTSHEVIQEGLYNMGVILKDKLEDYTAARTQFDRLLRDYPDNIYRLETYQNIYLMLMRTGLRDQAETFRLMLVREFPESPQGQAMRDPDYIDRLRGADQRAEELYAATYEAYMANNNAAVHAAFQRMTEEMPLSKIMPKFMFLHALAYVTEDKPQEFNAVLRDLLERYPDTDITPVASAWLRGMARGRQLHAPESNMRGMVWDLRLSNDSVAAEGQASFELNPDTRQLLVFTYPTDRVDTRLLLYEVARHNFRSFFVRDFDLETMNFGRLGLLVIHGFANMNELNHYRAVMASSDELRLPAEVLPVAISETDFQTLLSQGRSFEEYFRAREEQNYIDAQADILESIQTLPEAETEAAEGEIPQEAQPDGSATEEETEEETEENLELPESDVAEPDIPEPSPETTETPAVQDVPATEPQPTSQPATPAAPRAPVAPQTTQTPSIPATPPAPAPNPAPQLPVGSEGDDPLLE